MYLYKVSEKEKSIAIITGKDILDCINVIDDFTAKGIIRASEFIDAGNVRKSFMSGLTTKGVTKITVNPINLCYIMILIDAGKNRHKFSQKNIEILDKLKHTLYRFVYFAFA